MLPNSGVPEVISGGSLKTIQNFLPVSPKLDTDVIAGPNYNLPNSQNKFLGEGLLFPDPEIEMITAANHSSQYEQTIFQEIFPSLQYINS